MVYAQDGETLVARSGPIEKRIDKGLSAATARAVAIDDNDVDTRQRLVPEDLDVLSDGVEEVLHASRVKHLCGTGFFLLCFTLGVWLVSRADSGVAFVYAYTIITALAAAAELAVSLRRDSFLRITPQGLTIKMFGAALYYAWSDIEAFGVSGRLVGFNLSASYQGQRPRATSAISILSSFDVMLPDNYGRRVKDLAQHLNDVRAYYVR